MTTTTLKGSLRELVRRRIRAVHDRLEGSALARAMVEETVTREMYRGLLEQLYPVHVELERLATGAGVGVPGLGSRAEALRADLRVFGGDPDARELACTRWLCDALGFQAQLGRASLLGALYVLEGSRMGGRVVAPHLAKALDLPLESASGLDYHLQDQDAFPKVWAAYCEELDGLYRREWEREAFVLAAEATMEHLFELYRKLSQVRSAEDAA